MENKEKKVEEIQTFVFFDLEATGLHDRPRIVELCMLAVSRDHLLEMGNTATANNTTSPTSQPNQDASTRPGFSFPSASNSKPNSMQTLPNRPTTLPNQLNTLRNSPTQAQTLPNQASPLRNKLNTFPNSPTLTQTLLNQGSSAQTHPNQPNSAQTLPNQPNSAQTTPNKRKRIPPLPRVLHKYTRLYYPWKLVPPFVERINGLNNSKLEHLSGFTESSAEAIKLFLDFPKPIALVAHNGMKFDYPLLMAELAKVERVDQFAGLRCCDSLPAIKEMDMSIEREDIEEREDMEEMMKLAENFFDSDFDVDSQETKRRRSTEGDNGDGDNHYTQTDPVEGGTTIVTHQTTQESGLTTPRRTKKAIPTPSTPSKLPTAVSPNTPTQHTQPPTPGTPTMATKLNGGSKVRRNLSQEYGKGKTSPRVSYSQDNIYKRLFASSYANHRAECDTEALLLICAHYGRRFVKWADQFAVDLTGVTPMWAKRKSFNTK